MDTAFGILLLLASTVFWTFKSRVIFEHDTITVRKSLLGIPRYWKIPYSEVQKVQAKREILEGVKDKHRGWELKIEYHAKDKEPVDLGVSISTRAEAVELAKAMEKLIRLKGA